MDTPYYSAGIESLTVALDFIQGEVPDPAQPRLLSDQLTYTWGFANGMVPGQLVPATVSYGIYCHSAADIPNIQLGDLQRFFVLLGEAGTYIVRQVMKVAEVTATLDPDPDETHPVYVSVKLVDLLSDAISATIDAPLGAAAGTYDSVAHSARAEARPWWKPRLAEVGKLVGRSIGCPTWWGNGYAGEQPHPGYRPFPTVNTPAYAGLAFADPEVGAWNGKSGYELLVQLLNSHQPGGITHVLAPHWDMSTTYPSGYEYVEDARPQFWPAIADPTTQAKLLLVPASREGGYHGTLTLDADWCDVPAIARRGREHVIDRVRVGGLATVANPSDPNLVYKWTDSTLSYGAGTQVRDLPTQLRLFAYPNDVPGTFYTPAAPNVVKDRFLTDASASDDPWTYEQFQLVSSRMSQADAEAILPFIAPRFPGESDGDGQVLRHVTLDNLDPSIAFTPDPLKGFLTAGSLNVLDGDLIWNLALTPGEPT